MMAPGERRTTTRILIADDHAVVRRGLVTVLETRADWQVVAEAPDGLQALELAMALAPDVAILDYALPKLNGSHLTRRILAARPDTQVLIFTMHDSDVLMRDVVRAGARGYVLKTEADRDLMAAVEALSRHEPFFDRRINATRLRHLARTVGVTDVDTLTPREREVFQLIGEGHSNKGVGEILNIGVKTVETHRASALQKLGLNGTAAVVRYAVRNKLVEP